MNRIVGLQSRLSWGRYGDQVHIMGQVDTWYLVDHAGVRGYSAKQYIEIV